VPQSLSAQVAKGESKCYYENALMTQAVLGVRMEFTPAGSEISTILRHDKKRTSYKIALLRSINEVVLNYPDLDASGRDVAVPLLTLAERWIAYYWPFVDPGAPIYQGHRSELNGELRNDMAFRPALTRLRTLWEKDHPGSKPSDGFFLVNDFQIERKRKTFSDEFVDGYYAARRKVKDVIQYPIKHAGPDQWTVFPKPKQLYQLDGNVRALPQAKGNYTCLVIRSDLWDTFRRLSLWVEALCIHEWCLFTETVQQDSETPADRGHIYRLLTDRPDNRVALSWERNRIDLLLMEGETFVCPWTERTLAQSADYAIDHLLPLSVYPINELWNLVPVDRDFNSNVKRDRLPSASRLDQAQPHLVRAYETYLHQGDLKRALRQDVDLRFADLNASGRSFPVAVTQATTRFIEQVARARNLARF